MVIIGLLLIALACLILGLILQSSVWLIASLIATGGAGYLLYKLRHVIGVPKSARQPLPTDETDTADDAPEALDTDADQPVAEQPVAEQPVADDEVWVIDGRARYHLGDCAIISGQDAEPIPYDQATEDGFIPCSLCEPHAVISPHR